MAERPYLVVPKCLKNIDEYCWKIKKGFQLDTNVGSCFYVHKLLEKLILEELHNSYRPGGGFLYGVKQMANVAALPDIVDSFMVSSGGVGFYINCGLRLLV